MTRYFRGVFLFLFVSLSSPTIGQAQLGIEDFIGNRTLQLSGGVDVGLTRFGTEIVTGSVTAFAAVRDIQAVLDTVRPAANRRFSCDAGGAVGGELQNIRFTGSSATPTGLILSGTLAYRECRLGLFSDQASFSMPIYVTVAGTSVKVRVDSVSLDGGSSFVKRQISAAISSKIEPVVQRLNALIATQLSNQTLRTYAQTYKLKIQSAQLVNQGGDLVLTVSLAGQAKVKELNELFTTTAQF